MQETDKQICVQDTIVTLEIIALEIKAVFSVCQLWLNNSVKKQSGEIIFIFNILMKKLIFRGYVAYCHMGGKSGLCALRTLTQS